MHFLYFLLEIRHECEKTLGGGIIAKWTYKRLLFLRLPWPCHSKWATHPKNMSIPHPHVTQRLKNASRRLLFQHFHPRPMSFHISLAQHCAFNLFQPKNLDSSKSGYFEDADSCKTGSKSSIRGYQLILRDFFMAIEGYPPQCQPS